jgi:hypothetical protein
LTSPARTAAATRQRRRRARQREGRTVLQIEVDETDLAAALEAAGFSVGPDPDRAELAWALEARIKRWLAQSHA